MVSGGCIEKKNSSLSRLTDWRKCLISTSTMIEYVLSIRLAVMEKHRGGEDALHEG